MKLWEGIVLGLVMFVAGFFARPVLDRNTVVVHAGLGGSTAEDVIIYRANDGKMYWGGGTVEMPPDMKHDDPLYPEGHFPSIVNSPDNPKSLEQPGPSGINQSSGNRGVPKQSSGDNSGTKQSSRDNKVPPDK